MIYLTLVCDKCGAKYAEAAPNDRDGIMMLRHRAKKEGWLYTGKKDLCPDHKPGANKPPAPMRPDQ